MCSSDLEHQRQFVAESLTLSLNDSAAFLYLFRAIDCLDRLPRCNMQVLARAEHPVQHAAYSAQRLSAFLTKNGAGIENTGRFFVARSHRQHHLVSASPAQNLHRQDWPGRVARAARVIPPRRPAPSLLWAGRPGALAERRRRLRPVAARARPHRFIPAWPWAREERLCCPPLSRNAVFLPLDPSPPGWPGSVNAARLNRPMSARFNGVARPDDQDHAGPFCTMKVGKARGSCANWVAPSGCPARRGFLGALRQDNSNEKKK